MAKLSFLTLLTNLLPFSASLPFHVYGSPEIWALHFAEISKEMTKGHPSPVSQC